MEVVPVRLWKTQEGQRERVGVKLPPFLAGEHTPAPIPQSALDNPTVLLPSKQDSRNERHGRMSSRRLIYLGHFATSPTQGRRLSPSFTDFTK